MNGEHPNHRISTHELREIGDGELLQLWADGYPEALDELVDRHHAWLLRTVGYLSKGERDVESVVQDIWLDVMRGAASYRGIGSVRSWLETIMRHRITSTWRVRGARPQTLVAEVPDASVATSRVDEQVVLREQLRGLLGKLPAEQASAIWLVDVVGLSVSDVASRLGVSGGTVKSRCSRGRERLRIMLGSTR